MKLKSAAVKRVSRPEKQLLYLLIGQFLRQGGEYDVALDLACGPMPLADTVRAKQYIGVDLNEESLRQGVARHPAAVALHSTIERIAEDITGDVVLCFQCIGVNSDFQIENTTKCVKRMVSATRSGGTLLFNVGPLARDYFDEIDVILDQAFGRLAVTQYGRFYERRSPTTAMLLAYVMYYLPFLARNSARPSRLYICQDRKPFTDSRVALAA